MHESGIVRALVTEAETVVRRSGGVKADRIGVRIGALSGIDPGVVRSQWDRHSGALTTDAELEIVLEDDPLASGALGVSLVFVDVGG